MDILNRRKVFYLTLTFWLGKAKIMSLPIHAHDPPAHLGDKDKFERAPLEAPGIPPLMLSLIERDL